jgi:hypothetical protein
VNRKLYLTMMSRALAVLAALACTAVAIIPGVPAARGAGAVAIAVITPENTGGVTPAVLSQVGQAIYDGVVASGRYDVKGGGPLKIQLASDGDALAAGLSAGSRAEADQVLISDVLKIANGKILYRMTIYKINPVTFGRSQVFQQPFPPTDPHVFSSQFGSDLATLEAPRTNTGIIYAVEASGVLADTSAANGFHLGQRFNVVRSGKKVAEAQISGITDVNATIEILNPTPSYRPEVGDLLISQEPGPAIPVNNTMVKSGGNGALDIIALLVGAGAALLAIGHQGNPAPLNCPPPTPSGSSCVSPSPTGTGVGTFTVVQTSVGGSLDQPTFTFTFSKPVQGAAGFNFTNTNQAYVLDQIPPNPAGPPGPISGFGGAGATASFDSTGMVMSINVSGVLPVGHVYFINFAASILATDSTALTPASFRYPGAGTTSSLIHPMPGVKANTPVSNPNGGNGGGNNGNSGSGGNNNPKGPQPQPGGGHQPRGG